MNTRKLYKIGTLLSTSVFSSASCIAQPPAQTTTQPAACPQVAELLSVLGNKMLFDQTADAFLSASSTILKPEQDVTATGPSKTTSRNIKFLPVSGQWLIKGSLAYTIENNKPQFDDATFVISPDCFKSPNELIELARKNIGKGSKFYKTPPPDVTESLYWSWKDPDINMIRFIEVSAAKQSYYIIANRDPDSTGVAE